MPRPWRPSRTLERAETLGTSLNTSVVFNTDKWMTHGGDEVVLDLGLDAVEVLALAQAQVAEEHAAEDGVPQQLVNAHLLSPRHTITHNERHQYLKNSRFNDGSRSKTVCEVAPSASEGVMTFRHFQFSLTRPTHLGGHGEGVGSGDLAVQEAIEEVACHTHHRDTPVSDHINVFSGGTSIGRQQDEGGRAYRWGRG